VHGTDEEVTLQQVALDFELSEAFRCLQGRVAGGAFVEVIAAIAPGFAQLHLVLDTAVDGVAHADEDEAHGDEQLHMHVFHQVQQSVRVRAVAQVLLADCLEHLTLYATPYSKPHQA